MTSQRPLRLARLAGFDLLFWTPLWLVPLFAEVRPAAGLLAEDIVTSIAISALLAALAQLAGRYRRYFYLLAGLAVWIGAAGFVAYAVLGASEINGYGLLDASSYATVGARTFGYVTGYGKMFGLLVLLCLPFAALAFFWRRLSGPAAPVYLTLLIVIFLLPLPAKLAKCTVNACDKEWDTPGNLYPMKHFRPFDSYLALNDMFELSRIEDKSAGPAPKVAANSTRPLTLIVMVGETFNRNRMSLYGYCRPTTPNLAALKDQIFAFRDIISPMPLTAWAVPDSLHLKRMAAGRTDNALLPVLNAGGFDTYWISNQPNVTNPPNTINRIAAPARHHVWLYALEALTVADPPDGGLLAPLARALADKAPRKAIFLHMMGAHLNYADRLPRDYAPAALPPLPGARTAAQKKSIDEYDQALRYDDELFGAVIAQARRQGGDVAVVIYGDHGEENFDQMPFMGHGWPNSTRNMVEAPLVVWLSPSLRQRRPELAAALGRAVGERLQTGDISPVVVDLADLTVAGLPSGMRPLSGSFQPVRRLVYGHDYDADPNIGVTPALPPLCGSSASVR